MRTSSIFALSFLALAAVACGGSSSDDTSAPGDTANGSDEEIKASVIGEESNGKTVEVALGRSFTIALQDNSASSAYRWSIKSVDKTIGDPKESYVPPPNKACLGCAGTAKFTWSTKSPLNLVGKHDITLILQRPWAETTPPAKTFTVTVNIVDKSAAICGGLRGATCGNDSYCDFEVKARCGMGDQTGTCNTRPEFCPALVMPVCGCDGKTYNNSCEANRAGVSVIGASFDGACPK
jgi:predicted secreted protein